MDDEAAVVRADPAAAQLGRGHRAEDRVRAAGRQRDVERLGLRVIGHGPEVLQAAGTRAVVHGHVDLRDALGDQDALPAHRVDVDDVLVTQVERVPKRPGARIELPQDADLAHLEQRQPVAPVDEDDLEHLVQIVRLGGDVLKVPADLPGLGIQGQRRVRVQRRPRGAALHDGPRLGLGGGPVDQVGPGVVAARNPRVGAGAPAQRQVAPGVASRIPGPRHGRRAPQLGTGVGIVGRDEADVVLVPLAPRHARDDPAPHHDRATGVPVAEAAVGHLVLPDELSRPRVEGDELGPARAGEDPVAVDGDAAAGPCRGAG